MTPVKDPLRNRSENTDPNLNSTPKSKSQSLNSPMLKSSKSKKSTQKTSNQISSPKPKVADRKFIIAKKKKPNSAESQSVPQNSSCNCKNKPEGTKKCPCIAYQNLRASQEDFFKNPTSESKSSEKVEDKEEEEEEVNQNTNTDDGFEDQGLENCGYSPYELKVELNEEDEPSSKMGTSTIKRRRNRLLEEARQSLPEPGSGLVMHLVQAFEKLTTIPISKEKDDEEEKGEKKKEMKWGLPLPGMQLPNVSGTEGSLASITPSQLIFTSDNFGMDSMVSSSLDSSRRSSISRSSNGGRRSRRNSSDSTGTFGGSKWKKKQIKATRAKPFKLRTEQRGRLKEEEFVKKVQEMCMEEEKQRIPIAQGLPWTTDEPECLVKPPVKEITKPIDLKLHSDVRAVERAEFDQYVSEKLSLIDQYKLERERQQKLAEEEEIRRLRRELVPKAQPMPYFDRPFVPQRSQKGPTVPKEPRFHIPQHKKIKCMSWNDISIYSHQH